MSFTKLLHDLTEPKLSTYAEAYASLKTNPQQLHNLLNDPEAKGAFQIDFEKYAQRIATLFDFAKREAVRTAFSRINNKNLASTAITEFLIPLLEEDMDEFATSDDSLTKLITAILTFTLPYADTKALLEAACLLGRKSGVLEKVVTEESGANTLKCFGEHEIFKMLKGPNICETWLRRLFELVSVCPVGHQLRTEELRWQTSIFVKISLLEVQDRLMNEKIRTSSPLVPFKAMRELTKDDKKSGLSGGRKTDFNGELIGLPAAAVQGLKDMKIGEPQSLRAVQDILDRIRSVEFPTLLHTVLNSFPCKRCYDVARNGKAIAKSQKGLGTLPGNLNAAGNLSEQIFPLFGGHIGIWKILISNSAFRDLQIVCSSRENLELLLNTFRKLASGSWKGANANLSRPVGTPAQKQYIRSPLMKANSGRTIRILWQIHIGYQEEARLYRQVLRVWRVCEQKEEVPKAIEQIVLYHRRHTLEQNHGFSTKPMEVDNAYYPLDFPCEVFNASARSSLPDTTEALVDRHALELNNKFYALTKPVLQSLLAGNFSAEFPFDTSEEETEIIRHYTSGTLILGRSGTGKTTCLIYQLLSKYLARKFIPGEAPIRQVLLTRSPHLADKLKTYTKVLIDSRLGKSDGTGSDGTPSDDFTSATDEEDSSFYTKTLADLTEDDFPFVCTFERFMKLLENTTKWADRKDFTNYASAYQVRNGRRPQLVDFNIFRTEYWDHLSVPKGIAPELIFAEIMGVIKGSASLEAGFERLSREQYLERSCRLAPTFTTENLRDAVYTVYEAYERRKRIFGDWDGVDRVVSLSNALQDPDNENLRKMVERFWEEIYVDEIQDQRCIEIVFLMRLIQDPRGVHFAGDTAQCISKDSTFRFQDVKAMFYEQFSPLAVTTSNSELASPKMFSLTKNYRSHQGIIALSSYVMKLLYMWFPHTVDKLEEEVGHLQGPLPTVFVGFDARILATAAIVGLVDFTKVVNDFGADQVILVRDDSTKERVKQELGNSALVLNILDSKGMEFDDVLLFDFFSTTPYPSTMRYIETLLIPEYTGSRKADSTFDAAKHAGLCAELKQLYVAITRPRDHLWIVESSTTTIKHVTNILTNCQPRPLVNVKYPGVNPEAVLRELRPAKSSNPRKHSERGHQLVRKGKYEDALGCFERAKNNPRGILMCKGHISWEEGKRLRGSENLEESEVAFKEAVGLFQQAEIPRKAAFCLEDAGRFEEAGDIWADNREFRKAASLYTVAKAYRKASTSYETVGSFDEAAIALREGKYFNELVQFMTRYRDKMDPMVAARFSRLCNLLVERGKIAIELESAAVETLGSDAEKETFMKSLKLTDSLVKFYSERNRSEEAFQALLLEGMLARAFQIAFENPGVPEKNILEVMHYLGAQSVWKASGRRPFGVHKGCSAVIFQVGQTWDSLWAQITADVSVFVHPDGVGQDGFYQDIFSCFITLREVNLDKATSLEELMPLIRLCRRTTNLLRASNVETSVLPKPLAVVLGILFPSSASSDIQVLEYSPLYKEPDSKTWDSALIIKKGITWAVDKLTSLLSDVDSAARTLYKSRWPWRCASYSINGRCKFTEEECSRKHCAPLENAECAAKFQDLQEICTFVCMYRFIYSRRLGTDEFSSQFLGRTRNWLKELVAEATFIASFEQDTSAISAAMKKVIVYGAEFSMLFSNIDRLLHHLLTKYWSERSDFCSMLEQFQFAYSLSPRAATLFREALEREVFKPTAYNYYTRTAYKALNTLTYAIRFEIDNSLQFTNRLNLALELINQLPLQSFKNLHSFLSLLELLVTILFLKLCPIVVTPKSWIIPNSSTLSKAQFERIEPDDRDRYAESLLRLVHCFADLILQIDQDNSFQFCNKHHRPFLQERSLQFLVLVLINIAPMKSMPRGADKLWMKVNDTFRCRMLRAQYYQNSSLPQMAERLYHSFERYSGKDALLLISATGDPSLNMAGAFYALQKLGVQLTTLQSMLVTEVSPEATKEHDGETEREFSDEKRVVAARMIQKCWKAFIRYLPERRKMLATDHGKVMKFATSIIKNLKKKNSLLLPKAEVLLTTGIETLLDLRKIEHELRSSESILGVLLKDDRVSDDGLEELDHCSGKLDTEKKELRELSELLAENEIITMLENRHITLQKFRADFRETRERAEEQKREVRHLKEKLSTISCDV